MTIRTLSSKRVKKSHEAPPAVKPEASTVPSRPLPRAHANRLPSKRCHQSDTALAVSLSASGDRIMTAPHTFGRIVTIPDGDIAMVQLDQTLSVNGTANTTDYVSMTHFQWDSTQQCWKPKFTPSDK